jgi:uncharacterized protein YeaO (DUF488 family)
VPVQTKRVYEEPSPLDGHRILVDGLWPRGIRKEDTKLEAWMKDIAPSIALRQWYGHQPERWDEFRRRYREELSKAPRKELIRQLARDAREGRLTLVFGARDAERSNAAVIAQVIRERLKRRLPSSDSSSGSRRTRSPRRRTSP